MCRWDKMSLLISGKGNKYVSIVNDARGTASRSTLIHTYTKTHVYTQARIHTRVQQLAHTLWTVTAAINRVPKWARSSFNIDQLKSKWMIAHGRTFRSRAFSMTYSRNENHRLHLNTFKGNASLCYRNSILRLPIVSRIKGQ